MGETPSNPRPPVLELERAHGRDAAGPAGRARGALNGASIALGPGVHAFLGAPEDGTLALVDLVTGARPPLRGRVLIAGRNPARTPFLRARIGALAAEPRLPDASTVRAAVRLAMRARGETGDRFDAVLDPLGLSRLQARDPRSLSFAEIRAVELALALSTPAPMLLVLHEPLADVAVPRLELLPMRLREAAHAGACVILTTSSPADARSLGDHVLVLHQGLIAREARGGAGLVLGESITLHAWVRAGARELAAALAQRPEIRAVSWSMGDSSTGRGEAQLDGAASRVEVRGDDAQSCALAVIECSLAAGIEIEALVEDAPALGDVRTATETLWKMRARPTPAAALAPAPAPVAPVPPPSPAPDSPRVASLPPSPSPPPEQGADP